MPIVAQTVAQLAAQAFLSGLWQGLLLIAAVALLLRLQPRINPSVRFTIWTLTFVLASTLPLLHSHRIATAPPSHLPALLQLAPAWGLMIAAVWALLAATRLAQLVYQGVSLRRIWHRAVPVAADAQLLALLQSGRRAQLCISSDVDTPSVIGFFAPRLLVPAALMPQLSAAELRQIVLHECEHLHRCDDWLNLAQKIALALFPLNPALLWVDRQLGLERELACDAGVVARTAAPFDYAHCLTKLAGHRLHSRRLALALSAWTRRSELVRRVQRLLHPIGTLSPLQASATLLLAAGTLALGSLAMLHAPTLIAFTTSVAPAANLAAHPSASPTIASVPVVYRETVEPRATLLSARLADHPTSRRSAPSAHPRTSFIYDAMAPASRQPRSQMILTKQEHSSRTVTTLPIRRVSADTLRPVYLISNDFSPTYAAVPFGNGWLIVQL
jgi:beta-lactamase regulating signal transducer with metallopeptidase domain